MKYLIFLFLTFLLFSCSSNESVYWCGDHACINNKEKEAYFKKTMIIEKRELIKQNKEKKSELEIIKKQAGLEDEKIIKKEKKLTKKGKIKGKKELAKQARLEEKRRIKEEKELAKQARLEEKRRIKEEKELTKQIRLEEKKLIKQEKKISKKKFIKKEKTSLKTKTDTDTIILTSNTSSNKIKDLVEKINKKNMFKPYPDINDIPN